GPARGDPRRGGRRTGGPRPPRTPRAATAPSRRGGPTARAIRRPSAWSGAARRSGRAPGGWGPAAGRAGPRGAAAPPNRRYRPAPPEERRARRGAGAGGSSVSRLHGEDPAVAPAIDRGVVHLLGVRRRTDEDARRGGPGDVGRRPGAPPEGPRRVDRPVVVQLAVLERRPPASVPTPILPPRLPALGRRTAIRGARSREPAHGEEAQIHRLEAGGEAVVDDHECAVLGHGHPEPD